GWRNSLSRRISARKHDQLLEAKVVDLALEQVEGRVGGARFATKKDAMNARKEGGGGPHALYYIEPCKIQRVCRLKQSKTPLKSVPF
ncbi:hypothetical protein, partial [Verrucomicrobium spinosum]|uniref:hypothetical protein n=1 Tax=Verrucomicrobium spinosum TaxID=2736 RepID=UPI001C43EEF3